MEEGMNRWSQDSLGSKPGAYAMTDTSDYPSVKIQQMYNTYNNVFR